MVTAKGYSKYAGFPLVLFSHMVQFRINAHENAPLLQPRSMFIGDACRWPVVVFSHGLGGGRTAYTSLVTDLASKVGVMLHEVMILCVGLVGWDYIRPFHRVFW
mgnify:CR=1 FL=1